MLALHIQDIHDFMQKLLTPGVFDTFELVRCTIKTHAVFSIDGTAQTDWIDQSDQEMTKDTAVSDTLHTNQGHQRYVMWKEFISPVRNILSGKKKPSMLQIVFRLADYNTKKITDLLGDDYTMEMIDGLYLNISYTYNGTQENLLCTTGTSIRTFTLDKTLAHTWDDMICRLFHSKKIPYTQ